MTFFIVFLIAMILLPISKSKIYENTLSINELQRNDGWFFMDRMSFDKGVSQIKFNIKIQTLIESQQQQLSIQFGIVPDQMWQQQQIWQCGLSNQLGRETRIQIKLRHKEKYFSQLKHQLHLEKPTSYHFVLRDCKKAISREFFKKLALVKVYLEMKNGDYEHGYDEHLNKYILPSLLILTGIMLYYSKGSKHGQSIGEQRDWAKFLLFITLAFNLVTLIFYYIGFLIYSVSGYYYGFFDFMYLFFHSISQSLLTTFIIFIAYGWTITFTSDAQFDIYIPLICMLGLINLILTLLGKVNQGHFDKYHMYDSIPSYILIVFRVLTVLGFLIGIIYQMMKNIKNKKIVKFIISFSCLGFSYFLSLPATMYLVTFLPPSSRKQVVFFSVELIKNLVNLILTWMISSKRSNYSYIKHQSQSFFQSGNKLL